MDLVLSTSSSFLCDVTTVPPICASDHCVILLHLNTISCADPPADNCMPFYNWSDANYSARNDYLQSLNWNFVFQTCFDTESCWATFHSILTDALDIFVRKICPKVTCYEPLPTALLTDCTAHCQMGYNIVLFTMLYYNLVDAQLSQLGLQGKTKRTKNAHAAQQQQRRQGT